MTAKTFTNTAGGTWDTGTNWRPTGGPGGADDAIINVAGTYTVTIDAADPANTATLSSAGATLLIAASGQLLLDNATAPVLALEAGTLDLAGILTGDTIVNTGAALRMSGGTLDGVVWDGPLNGDAGSFGILDIKDGITVNNAVGNAPGRRAISTPAIGRLSRRRRECVVAPEGKG